MKKILFFITMMVLSIGLAQAQGKAEIKFDKTTHDFGTFSENNPVSHSSGCSILRMYRTRIYPGTYHAGKNRYNQGDLQRNG